MFNSYFCQIVLKISCVILEIHSHIDTLLSLEHVTYKVATTAFHYPQLTYLFYLLEFNSCNSSQCENRYQSCCHVDSFKISYSIIII